VLTIKNQNKIVGIQIHNDWYVKSINGLVRVMDTNGTHKELYQIVIRNKVTNSEGKIYLDRNYKNKEIKHWYELICERECGKRRAQLITKKNIKDIKQLIYFIKVVAIDI